MSEFMLPPGGGQLCHAHNSAMSLLWGHKGESFSSPLFAAVSPRTSGGFSRNAPPSREREKGERKGKPPVGIGRIILFPFSPFVFDVSTVHLRFLQRLSARGKWITSICATKENSFGLSGGKRGFLRHHLGLFRENTFLQKFCVPTQRLLKPAMSHGFPSAFVVEPKPLHVRYRHLAYGPSPSRPKIL